ncbi:hypothetical protein I4U23_019883 [Adineta vaga]|nr:hypothetical protein I4U23_019883 [Adineta vaga]
MALDLKCIDAIIPLPIIPIINNMTNVPTHSYYNPNGKAISQLISSSMAHSTFSISDIEVLLEKIVSKDIIIVVLLISSIVIGQMIYIAYQVNRTTIYLDKSIEKVNQEIYPKEITLYLEHLIEQLTILDQYSTQTNSIVVKASQSMFVQVFNGVVRELYFLDTIQQSITDSSTHIKELNTLINQDTTLLPHISILFKEIEKQHQETIDYLQKPLEELCDYANGKETEIDSTVLDALYPIHQQMEKIISAIENQLLIHLKPEENAILIKKDLERQIRYYARVVGITLLVLIIIFDLFAQGICRTVHEDQKFLIPFLINNLLGSYSNDIMVGGLNIETIFFTVIDDCGNQTHFSHQFFTSHLVRLQDDVDKALNRLNDKINEKFVNSITDIDMQADLGHLNAFDQLLNSSETKNKVQQIRTDFETIETQFEKITASTPKLPTTIVNQTIDNVSMDKIIYLKDYVQTILESTTDTCPLPLNIIFKADTFVCHEFATAINGLWFSLFLYMLFVVLGVCIGGLCLYKRLRMTIGTDSRTSDVVTVQF